MSNNEDWGWPYMVYLIWQKHAKFMTLAKGFNSKIENQHSIYFSFLTKDHNWPTFACLCLTIQINVFDISMNEILVVNQLKDKKMFSLTC